MAAALAAICLSPSVAEAQQVGSDWEYRITPYLWGAGLSGRMATVSGLPSVDVDASFGDILDNLDLGAMASFTARTNEWGVFGDLMYIKLGAEEKTPGTNYGKATLESTNFVATVGVEYTLSKTATTDLRLAGALRYWDVETDIDLSAGTQPAASSSGGDNWFDGLVGLRLETDLSDTTYMAGWAMVGGGGSAFASDLFVGIGYRFNDRTSVVGGYRYLSVDREDGSFEYDVEQHGPMVGLTFAF